MLVGDGMGVTVITGNRNVFDGWTTFRSATVAVNGKGFIARDLTVENTAGAAKHQAVVLRSFTGAGSWDTKTLSMHILSGNFTVNVKLLARLISYLVTQLLSSKNVRFSQDNPFLIRVTSTPLTEGKNPIKTPVLHSNFATYLLMLISRNLLTRRRHFLVDHGRNICELLLCNRQSVMWLVSKDGLNGMAISDLTHLLCRIQQYTGPGAALTDRVKWPGFHVLSRPRQAKNFTVAHFINSNVWLPRTGVVFTSGFRA